MRVITLLLVLASACVRPASPAPQAPAPKPTVDAPKKIQNRAAEVCAIGAQRLAAAQHLDGTPTCSLWGGRDTLLPDEVDAVVCISPAWILYCDAADNSAPTFRVVLEWPPLAVAKSDTPASSSAPPPAKDAPKKK